MDMMGAAIVLWGGEAGDSQLPFKSNKDDFSILISVWACLQKAIPHLHFSTPPGPSTT